MTIKKRKYIFPLLIIGLLFFVFGFLTWINSILIPYFQICMELDNFQATLVAFCAYLAYFIMAMPSALVLEKTGYRKGMVFGLLVMALGTLLFVPAAYTRSYPLFLFGLFVTATGLALVQTAANPYIAIMGPMESTAQRIGFMGLANKIAGIICLIILGNIFLGDADDMVKLISSLSEHEKSATLDTYALKIIKPYLIISIVLVMVAIIVDYSGLPNLKEQKLETKDGKELSDRSSIMKYPYLVLGVMALFVAGACETIPIDGIIILSRELNIPLNISRHFSAYTLFIMLAGYLFVSIVVPKYLSQQNALTIASLWGIAFTVAAYFLSGMLSIYAILALGFSASMLWGTIWGLALRALGRHTKKASALLIMSLIGGGILPLVFGKLLDSFPDYPQTAILILLPCYLFILYYALKGYKIENWVKKSLID